MNSIWTKVVATTTLMCLSVNAIFPDFLGSDMNALFSHFKIRHLTSVHNKHSGFQDSLSFTTLKVTAGELGVFVDSLSCTEVALDQPHAGAIFYIAAQGKLPCEDRVTRKLIQASNSQRPLFFYSQTESSVPSWLNDFYIPFNTSVHLILHHPVIAHALTLQEVYHLDDKREQLVTNVLGERTPLDANVTVEERMAGNSKWRWFVHGSTLTRRTNLMGSEISVIYPEESVLKQSKAAEVFKSLNHTLKNIISQMNASIKPSFSNDGWGMLSTLEERQADLALLAIVLDGHLVNIDLSWPYDSGNSRLYIRKPAFVYSMEAIMGKYNQGAMATSVALHLALIFALVATSSVPQASTDAQRRPFTFLDGFLMTMGAACLQGWERFPNNASGCIVSIVSILTGQLMNALLVSQLQAGLSVSTPTLPFRGIEDLLQTDYRVHMDKNTQTYLSIKEARTELMKQFNGVILGDKTLPAIGFCEKKIALLANTNVAVKMLKIVNCSVVDTKVDLFKRWLSIPLVKGFRFKGLLNYSLRRVVEGGLVQRQTAARRMRIQAAARDNADSFQEIGMVKFGPFLRIYGYALAASVAIFVVELACSELSNRRTRLSKHI